MRIDDIAYAPEELDRAYATSAQLIAQALRRRGCSVEWLTRDYFIAESNAGRLSYWITASHHTGRSGAFAASRKDLARQLLAAAGLEVPTGLVFSLDQRAEAALYATQLGDAVVKPIAGRKGKGVTVGVRTEAEFDRAWQLAVGDTEHSILVERRFEGVEARFLVVGHECVSVIRRVPPHVVGDGRSTVRELIAAKNILRSHNPSLFKYPIIVDDHRRARLRDLGFEVDDVVPDGVEVVVDLKAGISTGAESADITDEVHSTFKDIAVRAMGAVPGLDVAGIDIIASDLAHPAKRGNYIICEINTGPGIGSHHFPMIGNARDAAGAIADLHLGWRQGRPALTGRRWAKRLRNVRHASQADSTAIAGEYSPRNASAMLIAEEWSARGTEVIWLSPEFFVAEFRGYLLGYWGTGTHTTGRAAVRAATDKALSRILLAGAQLPVARGRTFRIRADREAAAAFAHSLGTAVVKPVRGRFSNGLTVGITSRAEFDDAWQRVVQATRGQVLVEEHFGGEEAEFLVVNDRSVAANQGGTDLTDQVHVSYHKAAERAVAAFPGLDIARVDIIAKDFRQPAGADNYIVCEVNSQPDILPFQMPHTGRSQNVAKAIVDMHIQDQRRSIGDRATIRRLIAGR